MNVLSLSDKTIPFIYSPQVRSRFSRIDLILGCGDLPHYYLEYVLNSLDIPTFYVRGNHDESIDYSGAEKKPAPIGGVNMHRRVVFHAGLLIAGIEGSIRYKDGPFQYTQREMWGHVLHLIPRFLYNRQRYGRYLDIFISHAPPTGIHDENDFPHQGIDAFRWVIKIFQPAYFFHGHVHYYRPDTSWKTRFGRTTVINTYGFRETKISIAGESNPVI